MMRSASNLFVRIAAFGLVLMTAIIGWQVFGRFVLSSSPSWTEQAALLLMIWYVLFAAAAGVREGFHIRIALLEDYAPALRRPARIAVHLLVGIFGLILCYYGAQLAWHVREHVIPSLGLSRGFAYLPLPFCGGLMALFAFNHALNEWRGIPVTEEEI